MSVYLYGLSRWIRGLCLGLGGLLLAVAASPSGAQGQGMGDPALYQNVSLARPESSGGDKLPLRLEVVMGTLNARLKLAPCDDVEPYMPLGTQLWGKTRVGLRCVSGPVKWNVFLPITIKAFGPAWVLKSQVAPGVALAESDLMQVEADWAERSSPVVANPADWLGSVAARLLPAGQVLRQDMIGTLGFFRRRAGAGAGQRRRF